MSTLPVEQTLDCRGLSCPLPILKTKKTVNNMADGEVLMLLTTDPGSPGDVAAWAKKTGNKLLTSQAEAGVYTFYIKKTLLRGMV